MGMLKSGMFQVCTWIVTFCFFTTTVFAQTPFASNPSLDLNRSSELPLLSFSRNLALPQDLGEISSIYVPSKFVHDPKRLFFIHVQDAHAHDQTQKKISEILSFLKRPKYLGLKRIGEEGRL